jgi:hypothetical protein
MSRLILPNSSNGSQLVTKSQTLSASGATAATAIFGVTGCVEVLRLWGVVTTTLGANHTAAAYRLNDQTAQVDITLNTGTALSAAAAGSVIAKAGLAAAAVVLINNSAGRVNEPTTLETTYFSPFVLTKKTAATTNIEYRYTTSDTPTSGVIQHFVEWRPVSADGSLVAL